MMLKKKNAHRFLSSLLILIAFGMGSCLCFGQLTNLKVAHYRTVDSLQILLKSAKADTNKVIILNALGLETKKESPENSIQYAERALTLSQLLSYKRGAAKALTNMALVYKSSNDSEKALECNFQSLKIQYEIGNKKEIIKTLSTIADLYKDQMDLAKAMEHYLNALTLYEDVSTDSSLPINQGRLAGEKKQQARLIYVIGKLCQNQKNYDGSLNYFLRALKLYEEISDENSIADVSVSIAVIYYEKSNHDKNQIFVFKGLHKEAMAYVVRARKIYQKNKNKSGIIRADNHLAHITAGRGEYGTALEYAFEGLKIAKEIKDEDMTASLFGTIGDVYYAQGNYIKSLEYMERCYKGAKGVNNKVAMRDLYLSFASIYAKLNNHKKAYEFHNLYSRMKDALINEQSNKQIAEMSARYDSEKKDKDLIKKDAEIAKHQAETVQQQTQRNGFIIGFALVLVFSFFIYRGYRNKQKANISITQQKEEVEKTYENISILSEIEQKITSSLSVEKIIEQVYENVNKLMVADVFCIGIHNPKNNSIDFPGFIENGKKYNSSYNLDDETRFPVLCFKKGQEIFINDLEKEYTQYIPYIPIPVAGERPESLIYLPLLSKEKIIGVITVESFSKNAYTKYHLNILKNLAVYVAIALENAQLYENLEEKVKERTVEVLKQKEEVEKSYENTKLLSSIGREITAVLSAEEIINKVYENVNKLMDASAFGIAVFNDRESRLDFSGFIENGEKLPFFYNELSDERRPGIWCFKNQKELFTNDFRKDYTNYFPGRTMPVPKEGAYVASLIYLPLSTPNKRIGVITVQSFKANAYTEYQLDILRNLAVYVVNALENAGLYKNMEDEVKHRTQEVIKQKEELEISYSNISILNEIGQQLTSTLDFESIFSKLHESVNRLMVAETLGVRIYHPENNTVEVKYEYDKGKRIKQLSFSMDDDDNFSVWCIKNKKDIFINDNLNEYTNYVNSVVVLHGEITHSLLFCPMIFKDAVIGVITVQSYQKNRYTLHHLDILKTLANYAAIAIENAQLYENMEERVKERTVEVLKQKEEVEKSYENTKLLSNIGREITAVLSVEEIINRVYENVNKLMDASAFGIGIINEMEKRLDFSGFIEKREKLPFYYNELNDEGRPAVWCFKEQKEMFINDLKKEFATYFPGRAIPVPKAGKQSESIIYLPLSTANKRIGVITVQSFKANAYTEYHLNILRNLALYVVNALENARLYENMEDEVRARTVDLRQQNEKITDSINYAKRIQEALLPPIEEIQKHLPESFILYKPKDIISGDFYWIYEDAERVLVAVADCTGHGVPGAFMSLMGNNLLNDIIKVKGKYTPSEILYELNIQILNALKQNSKNTSVKFGMDIALVSLEGEALQYAGAHCPLLIYRGNECIEIKADKNSIGFIKQTGEQRFTNHSVELTKGDMLYMFSDGYADQIGGHENKKIFARPFREILQSVCMLEMPEQKKILDENFIKWKGNQNQTDDILVVGIRV